MSKLYVVHGSPNCRKAQAVVHHLGLAVEVVALEFTTSDLHKPEFLAINPNGMVPAFEDDDGFRLWESNAIMQYLAADAGPNTLFPQDARARADITRWQFWERAHLNRATETFFYQRYLKPRFNLGEPDPALLAQAESNYRRFAPILETQLDGRRFVTGEEVTLADYALAPPFAFAALADIPLDDYPNIRSWYARIEALPAWQASAPPAAVAG
jgi:glutathione S-transferase